MKLILPLMIAMLCGCAGSISQTRNPDGSVTTTVSGSAGQPGSTSGYVDGGAYASVPPSTPRPLTYGILQGWFRACQNIVANLGQNGDETNAVPARALLISLGKALSGVSDWNALAPDGTLRELAESAGIEADEDVERRRRLERVMANSNEAHKEKP